MFFLDNFFSSMEREKKTINKLASRSKTWHFDKDPNWVNNFLIKSIYRKPHKTQSLHEEFEIVGKTEHDVQLINFPNSRKLLGERCRRFPMRQLKRSSLHLTYSANKRLFRMLGGLPRRRGDESGRPAAISKCDKRLKKSDAAVRNRRTRCTTYRGVKFLGFN